MMDRGTFEREYKNRLRLYKKLEVVARHQLGQSTSAMGPRIRLTNRIKGPLSLYDKAVRKEKEGKKVENPFEEIRDIVALTAICVYLSDVEKVRSIVRDTFVVIEEDDKAENTDAGTFGFLGINFKVKLKNPVEDQFDIEDIPFEIQVQTISQHAWASVSHDLDYKKVEPIPEHLRREFYALSGLLHVADKHFDGLREERQRGV